MVHVDCLTYFRPGTYIFHFIDKLKFIDNKELRSITRNAMTSATRYIVATSVVLLIVVGCCDAYCENTFCIDEQYYVCCTSYKWCGPITQPRICGCVTCGCCMYTPSNTKGYEKETSVSKERSTLVGVEIIKGNSSDAMFNKTVSEYKEKYDKIVPTLTTCCVPCANKKDESVVCCGICL